MTSWGGRQTYLDDFTNHYLVEISSQEMVIIIIDNVKQFVLFINVFVDVYKYYSKITVGVAGIKILLNFVGTRKYE